MKSLQKITAIDQATDAILRGIRQQEWSDVLPGTRILAQQLGLSAPVVSAALHRLAKEKWILARGQRLAYRINPRRRSKKPIVTAVTKPQLLILTHDELPSLADVSRRLLENLREQMSRRGWAVSHVVVDYHHAKTWRRSWDRLMPDVHDQLVIALYGNPALASWAARVGAKILFLGGVPPHNGIPLLAVNSSEVVREALAILTRLGHWRIVLPLCDRRERFIQPVCDTMRQMIEQSGHPYVPQYHNPQSDYLEPDVTYQIFETIFQTHIPTAIILLDWRELVTLQCFLSHKNLRIPEDVSLILLGDQFEAHWFRPALCRFRYPIHRLLKIMIRWLESNGAWTDWKSLGGEYVAGGTVASPRDPS